MSLRTDKVNSLVAAELNVALTKELGGRDEFATVLSVETSPDLRNATCWISTIPDSEVAWEAVEAVRPELQRHLSGRLELKRTPVITLRRDRSGAYAGKISEILKS
ncbi:MAG TPA: ribosome-binding factor A [Patescibacteria group bacterium]|jgi:ribosome-binding factor A